MFCEKENYRIYLSIDWKGFNVINLTWILHSGYDQLEAVRVSAPAIRYILQCDEIRSCEYRSNRLFRISA